MRCSPRHRILMQSLEQSSLLLSPRHTTTMLSQNQGQARIPERRFQNITEYSGNITEHSGIFRQMSRKIFRNNVHTIQAANCIHVMRLRVTSVIIWGHTNIRSGHTLARRSLAFLEEDAHRDTHSHATEKKTGVHQQIRVQSVLRHLHYCIALYCSYAPEDVCCFFVWCPSTQPKKKIAQLWTKQWVLEPAALHTC